MRASSWAGLLTITAACVGEDFGDGRDAGRDAPPDAPPFELVVHTERVGGVLRLRTNLPATREACDALPFTRTPCADDDHDALVDAWEDLVLDRLRPMLRFDEDEPGVPELLTIADIGRVAPSSLDPVEAVALIMLGYARDYGSCGGFTGHNGDSERVGLRLRAFAGGGAGDVEVIAAYTAAHEGTTNDHGKVWTGSALRTLVTVADALTDEPRWVVFPSSGKHATYGTLAQCEGVSQTPCFDEDCGPDGVAQPARYDRLPPIVNAGEDDHRLVDDLDDVGFPGDRARGSGRFCGGRGGTSCSSPVREKLVDDPFDVLP
jgi:hypothetical protein